MTSHHITDLRVLDLVADGQAGAMRQLCVALASARPRSPFGAVGFLAWLDDQDGSDLFADPVEAEPAAQAA